MILSKKLYLKRGFLKGLWINLRYLLTVIFVVFKKNKEVPLDLTRKVGTPLLTTKNDGELQCNACGLCIGHCPTHALDLVSTQEGVVQEFKLDILKCVECGLCQEVCPIDAIRMSHRSASANHAESNWILDAKELSADKVVSRLA